MKFRNGRPFVDEWRPFVGLIDAAPEPVEPEVIEQKEWGIPKLRDAEGVGLPGPGISYPASDTPSVRTPPWRNLLYSCWRRR